MKTGNDAGGRDKPLLFLDTESAGWEVRDTWLHYVGRMLMALQDTADGLGYRVEYLSGALFKPDMDLGAWAGVIALTHRGYADKDRFWKKWESRTPCVFLGSGALANNVESDQDQGMDLLVAHLKEEGHRRLAFVHHFGNYYGYGKKRREGFERALLRHRLPVGPKSVHLPKNPNPGIGPELLSTYRGLASGDFDAVCFSTDDEALQFLGWARAQGVRIPGDLAVTGYNDWLERKFLTGIHYDYTRVGRTAMVVLGEMLRGERPWSFPSIGVPPSLRIRSSSLGRPDTPSLQDARTFRELVESLVGATPGRENWAEELSHRLHLTRPYFLKKFRRLFGEEFARWLGRVRCRAAAFELTHTKRPITDLWLEVGFKSAQHFHQRFTALYGVSPRAWRNQTAGPAP